MGLFDKLFGGKSNTPKEDPPKASNEDPAARLIATIVDHSLRPFGGRHDGDPIEVAQNKLAAMGAAAILPILRAMPDHSGYDLLYFVEVLGRIPDDRSVPVLANLLQTNDNAAVRSAAAAALGAIKSPNGIEALSSALKDGDPRKKYSVRFSAAMALSDFPDDRAVPALIEALADGDEDVRRYSAIDLGNTRDGRAAAALRSCALDDPIAAVRTAAHEALAKVDCAVAASVSAEIKGLAIHLQHGGRALREAMRGATKSDRDNPLTFQDSGAYAYYKSNNFEPDFWRLVIPIDTAVRRERLLRINQTDPDRFVLECLESFQNWSIQGGQATRLVALMQLADSRSRFTYHNPIIVGDVAYVYWSESDGHWELRKKIDRESEASFDLSRLGPMDDGFGEKVMLAIVGS